MLLVVGTYRSNEVDEQAGLLKSLSDWRPHAGEAFSMQEILVENLNFDAVHQFINGVLSTSDSQTLGLASVCQKRTHGNVFFLSHFLSLLYRQQLLQYNFGALKWIWDENEIELKTRASENVVDSLLQKMQDLPNEQRHILRLAACLGTSFEERIFFLLWRERGREEAAETTGDEVTAAIEALMDGGYLQESREGHYEFIHDNIKEAASLLIPSKEDDDDFHHWVGQTLLVVLGQEDLELALFVVANLLNEGDTPAEGPKRNAIAELNRRACAKAMSLSAFETASNYAAKGIALLGNSAFSEHYELALDLFSTGAEAESCLGNIDKMKSYCQIVMQQTNQPIEDKLRVHTTWLDSLANRGHMEEAAAETLSLLKQFNVHFPRNRTMQSLRTFANIVKVKKKAKGDLLETILDLPVEKDATRVKLLHLMDRLSVHLFISHDALMPLVMFRNFRWTLKYGMNDVTPAALTTLGIIFAGILGDLQLGSEFADTALKLVPKVSPLVESRTLFVAHGFGVVWTQPMRDQLKPLQRAYESGLCSGDTESACWAIHLFYQIRYLTSFSLDLCIADVEVYMLQMKELNQVVAYRSTVVNYQMFMNLAGRTQTDPLTLVGRYCSSENHAEWLLHDAFYKHHCRIWDCYIYTIYGEHEECAKLAVKYGPNAVVKSNPGTFSMSLFEVIAKGVSSFIAARQTGRKLYKKIALSIRKRVKDWIEKGNPNVSHLDTFFDAEFAALNGKSFAAKKSYQAAIVVASRVGLLMDAGMFSEIYGEYLLDQGDKEEAGFRLQEATKYYREFGAHRKVNMLESKHKGLWPRPSLVMTVKKNGE